MAMPRWTVPGWRGGALMPNLWPSVWMLVISIESSVTAMWWARTMPVVYAVLLTSNTHAHTQSVRQEKENEKITDCDWQEFWSDITTHAGIKWLKQLIKSGVMMPSSHLLQNLTRSQEEAWASVSLNQNQLNQIRESNSDPKSESKWKL